MFKLLKILTLALLLGVILARIGWIPGAGVWLWLAILPLVSAALIEHSRDYAWRVFLVSTLISVFLMTFWRWQNYQIFTREREDPVFPQFLAKTWRPVAFLIAYLVVFTVLTLLAMKRCRLRSTANDAGGPESRSD